MNENLNVNENNNGNYNGNNNGNNNRGNDGCATAIEGIFILGAFALNPIIGIIVMLLIVYSYSRGK